MVNLHWELNLLCTPRKINAKAKIGLVCIGIDSFMHIKKYVQKAHLSLSYVQIQRWALKTSIKYINLFMKRSCLVFLLFSTKSSQNCKNYDLFRLKIEKMIFISHSKKPIKINADRNGEFVSHDFTFKFANDLKVLTLKLHVGEAE